MKVYIAGPMTGYPGFNIPAFEAATTDLRARGYHVVSPVELDGPVDREVLLRSANGSHADLPPDADYESYLERDFEVIRTAGLDAIVCLPGWQHSKGARREVELAQSLGIVRADYTGLGTGPGSGLQVLLPPPLYDGDHFVRHDENPLRQRAVTGAVKDNRGKPRLDLLPWKPLLGVGRVLGFGASKYKPHNWRLGLSWSDTIASALRHVAAFADGEDIDAESGEMHIDNAICQLLFLSEYWHSKTGTDDRWARLSEAAREDAKA